MKTGNLWTGQIRRYRPSLRPYPERLPPLAYPGAWASRLVSTVGSVKWAGRPAFLSHALAGEYVAFEPVDDGLWLLRFATIALARFDERQRCLLPLLPATAASADPSAR